MKLNLPKEYIYVTIDRKTRLLYICKNIFYLKKEEINTLSKKVSCCCCFFIRMNFHIQKGFSLKNHQWKYYLEWAFDKVCKKFDIEHRLTRPYTPKINWMVEKANDTV